jgi:hypothetical protein
MTSQTQHYIELSDIVALRFRCQYKDCNAILSVSLPTPLKTNKLMICPHCEKPWLSTSMGELGEKAISDFAKSVNDLARVISEKHFADRFSLVLEIKAEAMPKANQ